MDDIYTFATSVHTKMFIHGTWHNVLLSKPKSSFIFPIDTGIVSK